jgi:hypothetical protein
MAVTLTWKVEFGYPGVALTNLTSRVAGLDIDQQIALNSIGNFNARVTFNNFDGALTPGGGGTYGTTDWFEQIISITAVSTDGATTQNDLCMYGMITGFQLFDDGETSTVTMEVTDFWTIAGRTKKGTVATLVDQGARTYLESVVTAAQFGTSFPIFGYTAYTIEITDLGTQFSRNIQSTVTAPELTYADLLNQLVLPSQNGFMWPDSAYAPSVDLIVTAYWIGAGMTKDAPRTTFVFDPPSAITGTDLPITFIEQGYNIGETINTANMTSLDQPFGPLNLNSTNTAAAAAYGSRAVTYGQSVALAGNVVGLMEELTNRFATPTFGPLSITTTASAIKSYCANAAYAQVGTLLNISSFADQAVVTWTGAGAVSQTAKCIILGKRIRATPNDTEIILTLDKWADYHSFILDTDRLDVDRIA